MTRIALCAKMRRGKTTVANYLVERHGFVRIGFADKLKQIVGELRPDLVAHGNKPRLELQNFGQMAKDVLGRDVWVNYVLAQVEQNTDEYNYVDEYWQHVVIDDLRFYFEAKALRKAGFVIVKIEGRNQTGEDLGASHESELGVDKIAPDFTIKNDGTVNELYEKIDVVLQAARLQKGELKP